MTESIGLHLPQCAHARVRAYSKLAFAVDGVSFPESEIERDVVSSLRDHASGMSTPFEPQGSFIQIQTHTKLHTRFLTQRKHHNNPPRPPAQNNGGVPAPGGAASGKYPGCNPSPAAIAQMEAFYQYANRNNNGGSRGRCWEWVWKYITKKGYAFTVFMYVT